MNENAKKIELKRMINDICFISKHSNVYDLLNYQTVLSRAR